MMSNKLGTYCGARALEGCEIVENRVQRAHRQRKNSTEKAVGGSSVEKELNREGVGGSSAEKKLNREGVGGFHGREKTQPRARRWLIGREKTQREPLLIAARTRLARP